MKNKRTILQVLHLILNVLVFPAIIGCGIYYMTSNKGTYMRPLKVLSKHETGHDYKSRHYTDYFLTVQWQDRGKEKETFETAGETFVSVNVGEEWSFRRRTEFKEAFTRWAPTVGTILLVLWALSGALALDNREKL